MGRAHEHMGQRSQSLGRIPSIESRAECQELSAYAVSQVAHCLPMVGTVPRTTQPMRLSVAPAQHEATAHCINARGQGSTSKCNKATSHVLGVVNPSNPTHHGTSTTTTRTAAPTSDPLTRSVTPQQVDDEPTPDAGAERPPTPTRGHRRGPRRQTAGEVSR